MREGISETRRIHRQTFNTGAELLAYSALHPPSTLFYKLKLAIIYLRISTLYSDWLIQCFWNKTKDWEKALSAVNGVLRLARRWWELSRPRIIIGIAVSAVPKSHAHVLTLEKLTLLTTNPNQQIFLRITKTDQRIFLAIFLVVQPWRVNPGCQMPPQDSPDYFGHLFFVFYFFIFFIFLFCAKKFNRSPGPRCGLPKRK